MKLLVFRHRPVCKEVLFGLALSALFLTGCRRPEKEAKNLFLQKKMLHCDMERLSARSDSLWTAVAATLDAQLPRTLKPDERTNLIQVKNADLIRMFKVFPSLDTTVQQLVNRAGQQDAQIADAMKINMQAISKVEKKLNSVLQSLELDDKRAFQEFKMQLEAIAASPCK